MVACSGIRGVWWHTCHTNPSIRTCPGLPETKHNWFKALKSSKQPCFRPHLNQPEMMATMMMSYNDRWLITPMQVGGVESQLCPSKGYLVLRAFCSLLTANFAFLGCGNYVQAAFSSLTAIRLLVSFRLDNSPHCINTHLEGIKMPNSTMFRNSSHNRPATTYSTRLHSPDGSSGEAIPNNRSCTPHHNTESLQCSTTHEGIHLGHAASIVNYQGSVVSREGPSSTDAPQTGPGCLDISVLPRNGHLSSSSRLMVNDEDLDASPRDRHISTFRKWKWEILSIMISLGLLAGIFVTLASYSNERQPEWPYNININSLVSVLIAVIIAQLGFILAESTYQCLVLFILLKEEYIRPWRPYRFEYKFTFYVCS